MATERAYLLGKRPRFQGAGCGGAPCPKARSPRLDGDANRVAGPEIPTQNALRERVFEPLLDHALQRARAIDGIEARFGQTVAGFGIEREPDVPLSEPQAQMLELDVHDPADVRGFERMKHDEIVHAIQELGPEMLAGDAEHVLLHARVVVLTGQLLDALTAEIGGHDDDRVAKIDGAAVAIGQPPIVQHLQQDVEHIRVGLLDFIEQDRANRGLRRTASVR